MDIVVKLIFGNQAKQGSIEVNPWQLLTFLGRDLKSWITETVWKNEDEWVRHNIEHLKQEFLEELKRIRYEPNFEWLGFETELVDFKSQTRFKFTTQNTFAQTTTNFEYINKEAHDKIDAAITELIEIKYQTKVEI